jgi:FkbM family methyltransferase
MIAQLKTINGSVINIGENNEDVKNHFQSHHNCTGIIIEQMNTGRIYDKWLHGKSDLNILDCGGNVGLFALHVSDCATKVVTVEPTPAHQNIMENLTSNFPNIKIEKAALNCVDEDVAFYFNTDNTTMNSLVNNYNSGAVTVKGKTLKTILDENNLETVDFAKIDIEGSEYRALTEKTISDVAGRIKTWFIETHSVDKVHDEILGTIALGTVAVRDHLNSIFVKLNYNTTYIGSDVLVAEIN